MKYSAFTIPLLLGISVAQAAVIHVPSQYPTIQAGIDASNNGDTVLVADGTYTGTGNKNVIIDSQNVVLKSEYGWKNCIIDCENSGRALYVRYCDNPGLVIEGFSFTNANTSYGGGLMATLCNLTVRSCFFDNNQAPGYCGVGGAIYLDGRSTLIDRCIFANNWAAEGGGAIYLVFGLHRTEIKNCTFFNNSANNGSSSIICTGGELYLENTIISNSMNSWGLSSYSYSRTTLSHCCFWNNQLGNYTGQNITAVNLVLANPLYISTSGDSAFHLDPSSHCIDAGNTVSAPDPDGTIADIGAEWFRPLQVILTLHNPPVTIPAAGGAFDMDLQVINRRNETYTFNFWTEALLPNGITISPVLVRSNLTIPGNSTVTRTLRQTVIARAPAGGYRYIAMVGNNEFVAYSSNVVLFSKTP